jgi:ABC-type antimicrobial peptide transport system permease subunit
MNDVLSRSRGGRYALAALKKKRAELAAEIVGIERQLRYRKEALGHVDATLRLLDPSVDIDAIPNKRIVRRIKLFRQGELGRLIVGAILRRDYPVIQGGLLLTAAMFVAINLLVDVLYAALDPRVRFD